MNDEQFLIRALVAEKHAKQFQTNAEFHQKVTLLAKLLPDWIDGMAAVAEDQNHMHAEQLRLLMAAQPLADLRDPQ